MFAASPLATWLIAVGAALAAIGLIAAPGRLLLSAIAQRGRGVPSPPDRAPIGVSRAMNRAYRRLGPTD